MLRYLKGTIKFGLIYENRAHNLKIISYSDSDFFDDMGDRKSTKRQVFLLGGLPIRQNNLKQKVVALSSYEVEYISITSYMC